MTILASRSRPLLLRGRHCLKTNRSSTVRTLPKLISSNSDFSNEVKPDSASVSREVKLKNVVLATTLLTFCFGVAWYSTYAVGQAGGGAEDPLAKLRQEAAAAKQQQENETRQAQDAREMLQQFQSGGYDPDQYEDESEKKLKKDPWYKFW